MTPRTFAAIRNSLKISSLMLTLCFATIFGVAVRNPRSFILLSICETSRFKSCAIQHS